MEPAERRHTVTCPDGCDDRPHADVEPSGSGETTDPSGEEDEVLARARRRGDAMVDLPPDPQIRPLLLPAEHVLAIHAGALLERRQPAPAARLTSGVAGTIYVTSRRLMLVGRLTLSFGLEAIEEALLSRERLLLLLRDGQGLMIEVPQPRLLRVELAAARAAALAADRVPGEGQQAAR